MSIFEFNEEEEMKKIRATEYQVGVDAGIAQGITQGIAQGMARGILELLTEKGTLDEKLRNRILQETDLKHLSAWLKAAAAAPSAEAFVRSIQA